LRDLASTVDFRKAAAFLAAAFFIKKGWIKLEKMFQALFTACLIVSLVVALVLVGVGIYIAIIGRSVYGPEDRISILGFFSVSSHGGAMGLVFPGLALLVLCLILLSRFVPR
jgi:hypothetical protein